jgi:hypothetical protein
VYRPRRQPAQPALGGYIPVSAAYCYAVVVHDTSNDGTFIPAVNYVP